MPICRICGAHKDLSGFYPRQVRQCGTVGECKECTKRRVRLRRVKDDGVRAYDRSRASLPERVNLRARITREWRQANPAAYRAQTAVSNAVRDGRMSKMPCEVCGSTENLHAHHDDYSKPLSVRWLCALHHHRYHAAGQNSGVNP
jgi:hypothetical protein